MNRSEHVKSRYIAAAVGILLLTAVLMMTTSYSMADDNIVKYQVTGGELTFDKSTGTITACDSDVTEAVIPSEIDGTAVKEIKYNAFMDNTNLVSVYIPDSVEKIGVRTFCRCTELGRVTLPKKLDEISDYTFLECSKLYSVDFPEELTSIGKQAFSGCKNLPDVTLPDTVESIGHAAFANCSAFTKFTLPASCSSFKAGSLYSCMNLSRIEVADGNEYFLSKGNVLFNKDMTELVLYPIGKSGTSYTVPDGVKKINENAFSRMLALQSIKLPDGLESIGNNAFSNTGLESIDMPDSVTTVGVEAFAACFSLKSVSLSGNLKKIDRMTFNCDSKIEEIYIPENISEIGAQAFQGTSGLKKAIIANGDAVIDSGAFDQIYKDGFVIYSKLDSNVQQYALDNGFDFADINDLDDTLKPQTIYCEDAVSISYDESISIDAKARTPLTYRNKSPELIEVSDEGLVTARGVGTAQLTVTAEKNEEFRSAVKSVTVNISKADQEIISEDIFNKEYGDNAFDLNVKAQTPLSYYSSDPDVISVTPEGLAVIRKPGSAVITVVAEGTANYNGALKEITVNAAKLSQNIEVNDSFTKVYGCESFDLAASAYTALTFHSDDPDVAEVSPQGTVTVNSAGSAVITVTAAENEIYKKSEKKVTIHVDKADQKITVSKSFSKTFGTGTFSLGAKAKGNLSYKSSSRKIISVSSSGKVTMVDPGDAVITVTAAATDKYKAASAKVKVTSKLKTPTLSLKAQTGKKIKLSWSKVSGASGYKVYMYNSSKKKYVMVTKRSSNVKSVLHRGLKAGKTYRYKVRAYRTVDGKDVHSSYSSVKKVKAKR